MRSSRLRVAAFLVSVGLVVSHATGLAQVQPLAQPGLVWTRFQQYLESLRRQSGIPGLSGIVVQDGRIVWAGAFGFQDVENRLPATIHTPYHVAGLTQTVAATLALRCVEAGLLSLDTRVGTLDPLAPDPRATVRDLLAHTVTPEAARPGQPPAGPPTFTYDPARFATITPVIARCQGLPFRDAVTNLLGSLGMLESVPGVDVVSPDLLEVLDPLIYDEEGLARFGSILSRLAVPYQVDRGKPVRSEYPGDGINAAHGLVTTVWDLALFEVALDPPAPPEGDPEAVAAIPLLTAETLAQAWNIAPPDGDGTIRPHGLGWFVQSYNGERLVWQYGVLPGASSAFVIKAPDRRLTMVLLANSDGLVSPYDFAQGDVTTSLFAQLFLRLFL